MTVISRNTSGSAQPPNRRCDRRGTVLILALVCLALITVMGGALVRWAFMEHKLLRSREEASQARWLAEAGVERAAAKLSAGKRLGEPADYTGETWLIPAADLPGGQAARVRVQVTSIEEGRRSIDVEVEYPLESVAAVRVRKQVVYQERKP
jgi:type II secretory pathway component PulK